MTIAQDGDPKSAPDAASEAPIVPGEGDGQWVIPPVDEKVLAGILGNGAALPAGCRLTNGNVEYTVIQASYLCGETNIAIDLSHPKEAKADTMKTERFAISLREGTPPDGFVAALEKTIRANEGSFEWQWVAARIDDGHHHDEEGTAGWPWQYTVGAIAALVLGVLGYVFRRQI